ncbi:ATP-dependent DNA helicase PIF1-like [Nicotiana tomentosiformis]|uniref:ATP-dependent DNA helicase PIF1-like n=1 Tax=Nicotiana tomentosiformis TaxID=4098 RepID=UPI00388CD46A
MFEDSMSEDFKHFSDFEEKDVQHKVLSHINDILHSMGHDINEYKLIPKNIRASETAKDAKDIHFERNIIVRTFFVDGPGGTGKTFLYRALLATIRSQGFIALATATSGVAASILPGGRTAHSRFKMSIDIDDNFRCNISKQSSLACLIRDAELIVWDEVSMAKKNMIEALDALLRDIMDVDTMFGGKVVVFGDDFRQTLPVVRNGKKEDFIYESLLYSEIWNKFEKLCLSENMRARTDPSFCEYLLRIGNGTERTNCEDKLEIPDSFVIPFTTEEECLDALFSVTYPDLHAFSPDSSMITSRVILTTKNDFVNEINNMLITKFPQRSKTFVAVDETIDPNNQSQFEDFLHSLDPPGLPPYKLTLKENCPLYVALSRAKSSNCVKILIRPSTADSTDDHSTYNVVYDEIIQKAFS